MKLLLQTARYVVPGLVFSCLAAAPAGAIERLVLTVGRVSAPVATLTGGQVTLRLDTPAPALDVRAGTLTLRMPGLTTLRRLELTCSRVDLGKPRFACDGGRLSGRAGSPAPIQATLAGDYDPVSQTVRFSASRVPLARGTVQLRAVSHAGAWALTASASGVDLAKAEQLARPWFALPAGYTVTGHVEGRISVTNHPALAAGFSARTVDLGFSNPAGTVAGQTLGASLSGTLAREGQALTLGLTLRGSQGQALVGPVFLDFAAHPLALRARLSRPGTGPVEVSRLDLSQRGVIDAVGRGVVALGPHPDVETAQLEVSHLIFPGAFTEFLQLKLASSAQGSISSSGDASGEAWITHNTITRLDGTLRSFAFDDPVSRLFVREANGDIHWAATSGGTVAPSHLSWSRIGAYGLAGGAAKLTFLAWKRNFALLGGNARLPVFNGDILIHTLVGRNLGLSKATFDFDADLTPISMPRLCRAFHWPIMNGQLSGRIPLVHYRDHALTFDGNLVARVFDGIITGRHIRLENPLGQWPQLSADVTARGLDLDLVTHTFAFGSITGRVDADITGLKLFDWSPVAFDARVYTMPGDRSAHRISQKAVTRIAALGGGGGAVTAALESGVLQFFHTFHYRRLAIGCRLHNQVCQMSGVGPAPDGGYYLVQGAWLPRLDIIGNVRQVDWPRLLSQIRQGIEAQGGIQVR